MSGFKDSLIVGVSISENELALSSLRNTAGITFVDLDRQSSFDGDIMVTGGMAIDSHKRTMSKSNSFFDRGEQGRVTVSLGVGNIEWTVITVSGVNLCSEVSAPQTGCANDWGLVLHYA